MSKTEQQHIDELKSSLEKEHGRLITAEEASQAYQLVKLLAEVTLSSALTNADRLKKLKLNPKGFHLSESGTCAICDQIAARDNCWYDKNGVKCLFCQRAIDKKLIPLSVIANKDSWYSKQELESFFNISHQDLRRYEKSDFLKKRIVPGEGKEIHFELFLIRDNKTVLPPKKLLASKIIKIKKDGEEYLTQAQWYEFIDEKGLKKLQKYRIGEILNETFAKPIKTGSFYFKSINPLLTYKQ